MFLFLERQTNSSLRNQNLNVETKQKKIGNMAATQKFGHCGNRKQNLLHFTSFKISLLELKVILM